MKKNIAGLLVFVFTMQISSLSFAQSNSEADKKAFTDCYESLFQKSESAVSKYVGQNVKFTEEKQLKYLKAITLFSLDEIKKEENGKDTIKALGILVPAVSLIWVLGEGTVLELKYKFMKDSLKKSKLPKSIFRNMTNGKAFIENVPFMLMIFTGSLFLNLVYLPNDSFADNYNLSSLDELFATSTVYQFNSLVLSDGKTANEIRHRLIKSCQSANENFDPALGRFINITDKDVEQARDWVKSLNH